MNERRKNLPKSDVLRCFFWQIQETEGGFERSAFHRRGQNGLYLTNDFLARQSKSQPARVRNQITNFTTAAAICMADKSDRRLKTIKI